MSRYRIGVYEFKFYSGRIKNGLHVFLFFIFLFHLDENLAQSAIIMSPDTNYLSFRRSDIIFDSLYESTFSIVIIRINEI